jgi:P4 family phage/plasmid primase-like protien
MTTQEIAQAFEAKKTSGGWEAKCPAHDDRNASLSITGSNDGKTLLHCHAGCRFEDIAAAARLKPADFFPDEPAAVRSRIAAEYSYQDAGGKELYQVVRFEPKDFRQRRWDGSRWVWNLKGVERVLYRLPQVIEARDKRIIYVVEGEKDVAAIESLGMVATCNAGGAGKWEQQYTESLRGAMVVVIPDGDAPGRKHRDLVCAALIGVCKWVKSIELPVKDAALWVEKGGTKDEMAALIKAARVYNPADYPSELDTTASLGDMRSVTSAENGAKGGRPKAPSHADTAEMYAESELCKNGVYHVRHWRGRWYAYEHGCGWRELADIEIQGRLITYLRGDPELRGHATAHYAASVMLNLRAHDLCGLPESVQRPCWLDTGEDGKNWVAFSNGKVVNVWQYAEAIAQGRTPEGHERPLSPLFFSSDYVSYEWNPDAFPQLFHEYLERVQPDADNAGAVCRMMGLLMADTTRYETFWQMYGNGSNGKTVLLDVIKAMVGKPNLSYVPLHSLIERFGPWPLAESKVNICGELPTDVGRGQLYQIEGEFKNCVSGGEIEYEQKGKDKYFAKCRSRFVMATNSLPTFVDKSDGVWRRLRVIPFGEQIPDEEKDVNLAEKIVASEMPGVLEWALQGLAEVIKAGVVAECPEGHRIKQAHRAGCDHETEYLKDHYTRGTHGDRTKAADMYKGYREWMYDSGYKPLGAGKFYARVCDHFAGVEYKTIRFPDGLAKGFDGLTQSSPSQEYTEIASRE